MVVADHVRKWSLLIGYVRFSASACGFGPPSCFNAVAIETMPAPSAPWRKFHTIHKFGKKRKKGPKKLVNASSQPPASRDIANEVREAEPEHVTDVTSTAASAAAISTEQVRLDTPKLSVSEIIERKEKAEKRLEELLSTSATTRKASLVESPIRQLPRDGRASSW